MYKLKLVDKIIIIVVSCMIVTIMVAIIINTTKLIDSYIIADEKLSTNYLIK